MRGNHSGLPFEPHHAVLPISTGSKEQTPDTDAEE